MLDSRVKQKRAYAVEKNETNFCGLTNGVGWVLKIEFNFFDELGAVMMKKQTRI